MRGWPVAYPAAPTAGAGQLARDWAAARGSRVTALTVDHRLRRSKRKLAVARAWPMASKHHILLAGREAGDALQEAARARYRSCATGSRQRRSAPAAGTTRMIRRNRSASLDPRQQHRRLAGMSMVDGRVLAVAGLPGVRRVLLRRGEVWSTIRAIRMRDSQTHLRAASLSRAASTAVLLARRRRWRQADMQAAVVLCWRCCRVHPCFARLGRARWRRPSRSAQSLRV
jgi:hypothetical protein